VPTRILCVLPVCKSPNLHVAVETARGCDLAVRRNCGTDDAIVVVGKGDNFFASRNLPDVLATLAELAITKRGQQLDSIWRKLEQTDVTALIGKSPEVLPSIAIPEPVHPTI